ncbi:hypothetical protein PRUPE_7G088500 [Prunus persica]|uniref:Uncharacterized protein n=1 Tax=Prunus persica TaxID=3760 RepID=A0A251N8S3_PRUPE|nr:hypothetical protein PRUPE_7G088500 [Prunus persica]
MKRLILIFFRFPKKPNMTQTPKQQDLNLLVICTKLNCLCLLSCLDGRKLKRKKTSVLDYSLKSGSRINIYLNLAILRTQTIPKVTETLNNTCTNRECNKKKSGQFEKERTRKNKEEIHQ